MSTYTISPCLLSIEQSRYFYKIFLRFLTEDYLKIAIDNHGFALNAYKDVIETSKIGKELSMWLDHITENCKYEAVNTREQCDELFLEICKTIFGHKLLVETKQNFCKYQDESEDSIRYENTTIHLYDKDEAIIELEPSTITIEKAENCNIIETR